MFSHWPSVCLSVCPSVCPYVVLPHFVSVQQLMHLLTDFIQICICIRTNNVSLGIVNGQILIIYHRVMALVNVQKRFWPLFLYYFEYLDENSQKN